MHEFDILADIQRRGARDLPASVRLGPGDDMALLAPVPGELLIAVDQTVDGRHVRLASNPLELVGRKAVTRCLSDVAAMAGRPLASVAAAVLPPDLGHERAMTIFEAMRMTAAEYGAPLVGGDVAFHVSPEHPYTCSVTVLATPGPTGARRRDAAQVGDVVYVTGELGATLDADGGGHHLRFEPRIATALALAETLGPRLHALIDLSDGLGRDAGHVARASGVAIELDAEALPCRADCGWRRAVGDGEDYELLFTADGPVPEHAMGVRITAIGRVVAAHADRPIVVVHHDGAALDVAAFGWEHGR